MKKILTFVLILGIMLSMTGLVVGQNECIPYELPDEYPPFLEGPNAERCNRMYNLAPNGPWMGGPNNGPEA